MLVAPVEAEAAVAATRGGGEVRTEVGEAGRSTTTTRRRAICPEYRERENRADGLEGGGSGGARQTQASHQANVTAPTR